MVALVLALLAGAWLALLVAAPLLPLPISAITYALGSLICHQRPERSFHLDAYQLPVCARCVGIYAGAAIGALSELRWRAGHKDTSDTGATRHDFSAVAVFLRFGGTRLRVILLAASPTAVTVALEWLGLWYPSNLTRAIAGAPLGLVVMGVLARLHYGECEPPRPIAPSPPRPPI